MRIQIASDLHPEMRHRSLPGYNPALPAPADLLVLAGDIASPSRRGRRVYAGARAGRTRESFAWLQEQLVTPFNGRTVVVTHHGVAPPPVHPRYGNGPVNAAF